SSFTRDCWRGCARFPRWSPQVLLRRCCKSAIHPARWSRSRGTRRCQPDRQPMVGYSMADAAFFRLAGLQLRAGRLFEERDRANSPLVAVVNEAFVRTVSPEQSPVGRKAKVLGVAAEPMEIVGVVADGKAFRPGEAERPRIFYPYSQSPSTRLIAI